MPRKPEPRSPGASINNEPSDLTEPARRELAAEAAAIFSEETAREL